MVAESVLRKSRSPETSDDAGESTETKIEEAEWAEFLEGLSKDDFGKYVM